MLSPSKDRMDYGELLTPPYGYKLSFAVGTTYSLDLDALVGASMALGLSEDPDSDQMRDPICLLESLRSIEDKVALFCESGQIHLPGKVTPLYILLEKMVFNIALKKQGRQKAEMYPSFHPKFWLIRFTSNEDIIYRVIILSRNLTFDRSWDVSFSMDGVVKGRSRIKNQPLCDFLEFLANKIPNTSNGSEKKRNIRKLEKEIPRIQFEINQREFIDYEFIPHGIRNRDGSVSTILDTGLFDKNNTFHDVFAISPFISSDVIRALNESRGYIENYDYSLITRAPSLSKLKEQDVTNFDIYTVRDEIVEGESIISEESLAIQKQDIHAKVYMTRKNADTNLYLGSLNATHAALYSNVEFMIRLQSSGRYLNANALKSELFAGGVESKENPFQRVKLSDYQTEATEDDASMLDIIVKCISRANPSGCVTKNNDRYNIRIQFNHFDYYEKNNITICPLLSKRQQAYSDEMIFEELDIRQISEFFTVIVSDDDKEIKRVIKIPLEGIPEEREHKVVSGVIDNKEKFYKYITFILGDDKILSSLEMSETITSTFDSVRETHQIAPALYEKMLKTAADDPEKFKGIDYMIKMTSEEHVVPEEFMRLYDTIKRTVKIK